MLTQLLGQLGVFLTDHCLLMHALVPPAATPVSGPSREQWRGKGEERRREKGVERRRDKAVERRRDKASGGAVEAGGRVERRTTPPPPPAGAGPSHLEAVKRP